jgi:hypothetical protein
MTKSEPPERPIDRVLQGRHNAQDLDDLIGYFSRGHSVAPLSALLTDTAGAAIADGLYVLSELGKQGWPLAAEAAKFVDHEDEDVRFFAIACVAAAPFAVGAKGIANALRCLADQSKRVRWRAIALCAVLEDKVLKDVLTCFEGSEPDAGHRRWLSLLSDLCVQQESDIEAGIRSPKQIDRSYGVAAAARLVRTGERLAKIASNSGDAAVSEFAQHLR